MSNGGRVVATEQFEYVQSGDSTTISAVVNRRARGASGVEGDFIKRMTMVLSTEDFSLRSYLSNLEFDGHTEVKGIIPAATGDTSMTVYSEVDGAGGADRLVQPPGRFFIMDPGMFTLFDVICHNLKGKTFTKRPLQLLTLGETSQTVEATIALVGRDTIAWGARRVPVRKLELSDPSGSFFVWTNDKGQLIRLEHSDSPIVVMREAPKAPKAAVRKPVARKPAAAH